VWGSHLVQDYFVDYKKLEARTKQAGESLPALQADLEAARKALADYRARPAPPSDPAPLQQTLR
jgi:hypothetical protein